MRCYGCKGDIMTGTIDELHLECLSQTQSLF